MRPPKAFFCILVFGFVLFGCTESENPTAPVNPYVVASGLTNVEPIPLPAAESKKEIFSDSAIISADTGGVLKLDYMYKDTEGKMVSLKAWLRVSPGALPQDTRITMAFDSSLTGVQFQPEGLQFITPARLDFIAQNLGAQPAGDIFFFYMNEGPGGTLYDLMAADSMIVNLQEGHITMLKGLVPHFSRYIFGRLYGGGEIR